MLCQLEQKGEVYYFISITAPILNARRQYQTLLNVDVVVMFALLVLVF